MTRLVSIALSLTVLFQGLHLSLSDVVQLDELLEHARYHEQQFGDDFLTFLSKHYGEQKEDHSRQHSEEKEQHEQLPFQHSPQLCGSYTFILKQSVPELDVLPENREGKAVFYYLPLGSASYESGIFQPPRRA